MAIGLGSNMGDATSTVLKTAELLSGLLDGMRLSPLYLTEPIGGPPQRDYVNAVAIGVTRLSPGDLLKELHELERRAGRRRGTTLKERNSPRPLDLDILLFGDRTLDDGTVTIPHPRLASRRFALAPLADLVPEFVVPGAGETVRQLLLAAPPQRVQRLPAGLALPTVFPAGTDD